MNDGRTGERTRADLGTVTHNSQDAKQVSQSPVHGTVDRPVPRSSSDVAPVSGLHPDRLTCGIRVLTVFPSPPLERPPCANAGVKERARTPDRAQDLAHARRGAGPFASGRLCAPSAARRHATTIAPMKFEVIGPTSQAGIAGNDIIATVGSRDRARRAHQHRRVNASAVRRARGRSSVRDGADSDFLAELSPAASVKDSPG
jgi:hypothetical protein